MLLTDPRYSESWSKALLWPDGTGRPFPCYPVSKHTHPLRTQAKHNVWEHCLTLLPLLFLTSISYACLVVLLCVFRACEVQREAEVMAVCLVLGWCNVMFFARGFEMLGPYVITIQKVRMGFYTSSMSNKNMSLLCSHTCSHMFSFVVLVFEVLHFQTELACVSFPPRLYLETWQSLCGWFPLCSLPFPPVSILLAIKINTNFTKHSLKETFLLSYKHFFLLSPLDSLHDSGGRFPSSVSLISHQPLLPIWAQRWPHRSACGPHHPYTCDCPCVALHLLSGFPHPSAKSAHRHDEWHTMEGGPGERWALEDSGNRVITHTCVITSSACVKHCCVMFTAVMLLFRWWPRRSCWRGGFLAVSGLDLGSVGWTMAWKSAGISGKMQPCVRNRRKPTEIT